MQKILDLTGVRFGRLTATSRHTRPGCRKSFWTCICDCGKETSVFIGNLRSGSIKSCGCLRLEILDRTTHGLSATPEYEVWTGMIDRCMNQECEKYADYGGRGIRVCERWLDVRNFYADMAPRPEGLSLGRRDNDGDYTPDNCRWESWDEQRNNKRTTVWVTYMGEEMSISQCARKLGIHYQTLRSRLLNGSLHDALTKPLRGRKLT